jgi:sulfate-transporting ATPase
LIAAGDVVIEARGLAAGYGRTVVVRDLDLTVKRGEVVALLGANGAGKTTSLLTMAGDLPSIGGQVMLLGTDVTDAPLHRRARAGLALVTETRCVVMGLTVRENLRVNRGDDEYALALFPELEPHLDRRAGMLSGGQQQMLALARALSRRPKVLLADELSLGLAPLLVDRLLAAVRDAANEGLGVLLVEQHVHKAMDVADRAVVLRRGRIELAGTTDELRSRLSELEGAYLTGAPAAGRVVPTAASQR